MHGPRLIAEHRVGTCVLQHLVDPPIACFVLMHRQFVVVGVVDLGQCEGIGANGARRACAVLLRLERLCTLGQTFHDRSEFVAGEHPSERLTVR